MADGGEHPSFSVVVAKEERLSWADSSLETFSDMDIAEHSGKYGVVACGAFCQNCGVCRSKHRAVFKHHVYGVQV